MTNLRLKTEIIISAELRNAQKLGFFSTILKKGDMTAGQIFLVISKYNTEFILIGPPFGSSFDEDGQKLWDFPMGSVVIDQQKLNDYLSKMQNYDPDINILEIEDPSLEYRPTGKFVAISEEMTSVIRDAESAFKN
ncbi:MAG: DUF1491 family protein [Hyphomicrobiales bacterium]